MINCRFENGNKDSLRHVTVTAMIVKGNKILLGKRGTFQGKPILESGKWALIGGFLDRDETLTEGIKREIKEETGLEVEVAYLFRIVNRPDRPSEDRQNVEIVFIVTPVTDRMELNEESEELKWFDLDNLPSKSEMAFDHLESIELYKKYILKSFNLPLY